MEAEVLLLFRGETRSAHAGPVVENEAFEQHRVKLEAELGQRKAMVFNDDDIVRSTFKKIRS